MRGAPRAGTTQTSFRWRWWSGCSRASLWRCRSWWSPKTASPRCATSWTSRVPTSQKTRLPAWQGSWQEGLRPLPRAVTTFPAHCWPWQAWTGAAPRRPRRSFCQAKRTKVTPPPVSRRHPCGSPTSVDGWVVACRLADASLAAAVVQCVPGGVGHHRNRREPLQHVHSRHVCPEPAEPCLPAVPVGDVRGLLGVHPLQSLHHRHLLDAGGPHTASFLQAVPKGSLEWARVRAQRVLAGFQAVLHVPREHDQPGGRQRRVPGAGHARYQLDDALRSHRLLRSLPQRHIPG